MALKTSDMIQDDRILITQIIEIKMATTDTKIQDKIKIFREMVEIRDNGQTGKMTLIDKISRTLPKISFRETTEGQAGGTAARQTKMVPGGIEQPRLGQWVLCDSNYPRK